MDVILKLHLWHVLALITAMAWSAFFVWPRKPASGYGTIGSGLLELLAAAALLIVTLVMWLIYFASTAT